MTKPPQLPKPLPRRHGFTLLEVMLAVMVFAVAVLGLLTALHTSVDAATRFNREAMVALSLQNQLAEAKEETWGGPGTETNGPDEFGVMYTRDIEPLEIQNREGRTLDRLYRLKITAVWGSGEAQETQTAEVYVHKP